MEKSISLSRENVPSLPKKMAVEAKVLPQYAASLASTLGALAGGMVLGWSSPAGEDGNNLKDGYPDMTISSLEFSWIGSLATLGAGLFCVPIGILCDLIGRKHSMLVLIIPFTIGWLCIIFAKSVTMFYIGRFATGLGSGAFCVTVPMYTAEIAESQIRGRLGSYLELFLTSGILCAYILGKFVNMFVLSIVSATVPLLFFAVFVFMPESPIYYLEKGNDEAARKSLIRLRGKEYDVDNELQEYRKTMEETKSKQISFTDAIRTKAAFKGFIITFGLMFFQQLSGVNAIIFYTQDIFDKADSGIGASDSAIIVGSMQVAAVFVSTLIVDRVGRKILLLCSSIATFTTTLLLGIYFYLLNDGYDMKSFGWLPLSSICIFIILLEVGFGPIPWVMTGEIFAAEIKGVAASSACLFNWLMAFIVTKFYSDMNGAFGVSGTFWTFSGMCGLGILFVIFVVPETKGKTLDEIQRELNGVESTNRKPDLYRY